MQTIWAVGLFLLGLGVGSFANVLIYRVPRRLSFVAPRSFCPSCGHVIRPYDNIPIISYLWLCGRCRDCGAGISIRYPVVELLCGSLWLGVFWHPGLPWTPAMASWTLQAELWPGLFFVTVLLVISGIDLDEQIIPNRIVLPSIVIALLAVGAVAAVRGDYHVILHAVYGMLIGGGFLGIIAFLAPRGMGMGDAKLAAFLGIFLGFYILAGLLIAFLLGSIGGIILLAAKRKGRRERIPFGPFLALGGTLALFWGEPLYRLYRSLFHLG